ncbi:hypothetical protein AC578_814 [Pseudocercospora eumusae]|uniref:Uncharacterized protein n=1 Tax=Pseudocercospora eumusae TaxID=321146 RepID=A0A139HBY9_9PEZI|nr:hypothetical protein AC578_814 [Pseudocercospora eumusae]
MSSRTAFPPMRVHKTRRISTKQAQPIIAAYIERSKKKPSLHPDAWLAIDGIRFGPKGGPSGGWAIHHLKRIEAGMRGESLMPESKDDLVARFGEEEAATHSTSLAHPSDHTGLDDTIEQTNGAIDKEARKAAKKARRSEEKKDASHRKRQKKNHDIHAWASDSAAAGPSDHEQPSGYTTPYQDSLVAYEDRRDPADLDEDPDAQPREEYERQQDVVEGEVGKRGGALVSKQNGKVPLLKHKNDGEVEIPKRAKTEEEKAARRAAKKARRAEYRATTKDSNSAAQSSTGVEKDGGQVKKGSSHSDPSASGTQLAAKRTNVNWESKTNQGICERDGCNARIMRGIEGNLLCQKHYDPMRYGKRRPWKGQCEIQGCSAESKRRNVDGFELCWGHYYRKLRNGRYEDKEGNLELHPDFSSR